jgi:hypothetical protein
MRYIKRIVKQDVGKSFFVSKEAFDYFFSENPPEKAIAPIDIIFNTTELTAELQNNGESDFRIIKFKEKGSGKSNRPEYSADDLAVFEIQNKKYELKIVKNGSKEYLNLANLLGSKNHLVIESKNYHLNQILYGPPGTGKTYASITKALDIINIQYSDYQDAEEKFRNELGKRIEFVTMHQSFSYEDFIQGLKPEFDESVNVLKFRYKDGVFKQICERASNCVNGDDADEPSVTLSNTEVLTIAFYLSKFNGKRKIEKKANDFLKYISDNQAFFDIGKKIGHNPLSLKNHRDKFDFMFNDRDGYTARTGWLPRNKDGVLDNSTTWPYKDVYDQLNGKSFDELSIEVNQLLSKKVDASYTREGNCNHVIILDEINRANISRVFGELIALIETEKRGGRLTCTLPSGDRFTVPSNLYVIGTMNTADKSIALVDIALRRRFRFIPLYPDLAILEDELKRQNTDADEINTRKYLLENLNKIIRGRKSVDFEIGHSYFLKKDLTIKDILNEQIIPLMNEYFLNNTTSIKNILEDKVIGITCDRQILESRGLLYVSSDYVIPSGL